MKRFFNKVRESYIPVAKRIGSIVLAGSMIASCMAGCANSAPNKKDPDIGGISGEAETGKYSNLLMSVVNDEYYKSIMSSTTLETNNVPELDPHPYAFLEDEGIDVDKILNGTYQASTMTFVYDDEPNNLYMNTRILIDDSYYQSYLITYQLNDKEMADYKMVYGDSTAYSYSWPAFFINDKISETKQPTQVLSTKYTKKTHEVFQKKVDSYIGVKHDYILPSIGPESSQYLYLSYPRYSNSTIPTQTKTVFIAQFKYNHIANNDSIYEISENFDRAELLEKETKQATAFFLQDTSVSRGKDFEALGDH